MREIFQDEAIEIRREILKQFHQLCEKHNLRYSLAYGTLLGAIRHGGMIPWDDDIDLTMPREDYEVLCKLYPANDCKDRYQFVCNRNHPEIKTKIGYFIDYTTVTETAGFMPDYHGIHIDIYPLDVMPNDSKERKALLRKRKVLHRLIQIKDLHPQAMKGMQKWIRYILQFAFAPIRAEKVYAYFHKLLGKWSVLPEEEKKEVCCLVETGKPQIFSYASSKEYALYSYDGCEYFGFKDYDTPLRVWYGDYMQLPPEDQRVRPAHNLVRYYKKG